MLLVFLVFLAPAAGGWLWYHYGSGLTARHYGTLYTPARALNHIAFSDKAGESRDMEEFRGSWVLAYVGDGPCRDDCLAQVDKLGRVRLSLAKNVRRVRPLYLSSAAQDAAAAEHIEALMPGGTIGTLDAGSLAALVAQLAHEGEGQGEALHRIYLIDPIGNLVLSYESDADPARMRKDLSRLLHVSQIG